MRSEYALVPPHPLDTDRATVTRPHQIGMVFTGHHRVVHTDGGRRIARDIPPGSATVSGSAQITWLRVDELTEAMEIYPDPALVATMAQTSASRPVSIEPRVGVPDATVLGIGSVLRQAHVCDAWLSDVAASTLAHRLAAHLLQGYGGVRGPAPTRAATLDAATIDRVAQLVEARLHGVLTLDDLAAAAQLSPFHFARLFARTTGLPPYRFVTSRRMDRARLLLWSTNWPVEQVAKAVGFDSPGHFRRIFRRFHGTGPAALRAGRPAGAETARTDLVSPPQRTRG
jgi:AraC family transcriptional regulator